jgi:ketosteroid isomerase-like protein
MTASRDTERAMSRENVELSAKAYEAFARGDVEAVLERLDRDVDWRPAIAPILGVNAARGRGREKLPDP